MTDDNGILKLVLVIGIVIIVLSSSFVGYDQFTHEPVSNLDVLINNIQGLPPIQVYKNMSTTDVPVQGSNFIEVLTRKSLCDAMVSANEDYVTFRHKVCTENGGTWTCSQHKVGCGNFYGWDPTWCASAEAQVLQAICASHDGLWVCSLPTGIISCERF